MIIDDEIDVIKKVKMHLESEEINIVSANNSRQALEYIKEKTEKNFDLILIDTPMPGGKKSALFSIKPSSKLFNCETDSYLQKPFTKEQLVNFVKDSCK